MRTPTKFPNGGLKKNKEKNNSEKILLVYYVQRNEKLKAPGSLWAECSILKTKIFQLDSIDISKFTKLVAHLKRKHTRDRPKKVNGQRNKLNL